MNEIKLNSRCEFTLVALDFESLSFVSLTIGGIVFTADFAVGIAGVEHLVTQAQVNFGSLTLLDEFWFATPFESVTDVNLLPNVVVIPPGKFFFVKKRFTATLSSQGITVTNLAIMEDVTFPDPGAKYGATSCDGDPEPEGTCVFGVETNPANQYQRQTFGFGDILTLQGVLSDGVSITSITGFCATLGGNTIKKYSASGLVKAECAEAPIMFEFEQLTLGGIKLFEGFFLSQSVTFTPAAASPLVMTTGATFTVIGFSASTSISTSFITDITLSGLTISLSGNSMNVNVNVSTAGEVFLSSFSLAMLLSPHPLPASFYLSGSVQAGVGFSGLAAALTVSQGIFSTSQSLQFVRNPTTSQLEYAAYSANMNLGLPPVILTIGAVFGRAGLSQASFGAGLVF